MHQVEIRIEGHLDVGCRDWLGDFTLTHTAEDQSLLTGSFQDQAALFCLITKLRYLGVVLVTVNYSGQPSECNSW